jgi:hypothetical protein
MNASVSKNMRLNWQGTIFVGYMELRLEEVGICCCDRLYSLPNMVITASYGQLLSIIESIRGWVNDQLIFVSTNLIEQNMVVCIVY